MILKEFNFFRKKARDDQEVMGEEDFEIINNQASSPVKTETFEKIEEIQEVEVSQQETKPNPQQERGLRKMSSSTKLDWSDNETVISDFSEPPNPRHLSSPKKKVNRNNHYTISQSFKVPLTERNDDDGAARSLPTGRQSSNKSCLINRFLKNVTMKKMMDAKSSNKQKNSKKIMSLYIKGVKPNNVSDELDRELAKEIENARQKQQRYEDTLDKKMIIQFRKDIFRSRLEKLARVS